MKRPEPKAEIIVRQDTILDDYLNIHLSTDRAVAWMNAEARRFRNRDYGNDYIIGENSLKVNPCYNINEVLEYLSNPIYEKDDKDKPICGWKRMVKNGNKT